jgi:hypothetical protein
MMNTPRRLIGLLLLGVWIVGEGCGVGPGAGGTHSVVSGMVKVKGRPVASGEVTFEPTGGAAAGTVPVSAEISNGSYEAILPPGQYRVTVKAKAPGGVGARVAEPVGKPQQLEARGKTVPFNIDL